MKIKIFERASILILFILIPLLLTMSCSPKVVSSDGITDNKEPDISISSNTELLSSHKENSAEVATEEYSSPLKHELEGLEYVLSPYLSPDHDLFIGDEDKKFIENNFLNPDNTGLYILAADWERVITITFSFDDNYSWSIKKFITNFANEEKIERQYAVSGLMNLLSLRYSLSLDMDNEDIQKSNILTDLDSIAEKHRLLIGKAFRLGFTDFSVDEFRLFRPTDYLSHGEAISMLYRVFTNLGLPATEQVDSFINEDTSIASGNKSILNQQQETYSVESIYNEYRDYKNSLEKSNSSDNKKRLVILNQVEALLGIDLNSQISKHVLSIIEWVEILNQVFGIDKDEIKSYACFNKDGALTYDIVSITVYEFSYLMGGKTPRNANEQELSAAREAIQQFDTAEDISKFAQLYSSGMLEGIYELPGFTPKRPVNNAEAMLIIMRIVKGLSI